MNSPMCLCFSGEENQLERIHCVHNVGNKVEVGHESNNKLKIPCTAYWAVAWSGIVPEAVEWPDDGSCDVHQHSQHIADYQNFVNRCREAGQQASDS